MTWVTIGESMSIHLEIQFSEVYEINSKADSYWELRRGTSSLGWLFLILWVYVQYPGCSSPFCTSSPTSAPLLWFLWLVYISHTPTSSNMCVCACVWVCMCVCMCAFFPLLSRHPRPSKVECIKLPFFIIKNYINSLLSDIWHLFAGSTLLFSPMPVKQPVPSLVSCMPLLM